MSHMTHKSHVKFICFNASMLNEFVDRLLLILIIILQGALIDQRAVAAGKNASFLPSCFLGRKTVHGKIAGGRKEAFFLLVCGCSMPD